MKVFGLFIGSAIVITMACMKNDMPRTAGLEKVFEDSTYQITGIAYKEGRFLLVNYPRWSPVYEYGVVMAQGLTGKSPYPDKSMNDWQPGEPGQQKWVCVQSSYVDDAGTV